MLELERANTLLSLAQFARKRQTSQLKLHIQKIDAHKQALVMPLHLSRVSRNDRFPTVVQWYFPKCFCIKTCKSASFALAIEK